MTLAITGAAHDNPPPATTVQAQPEAKATAANPRPAPAQAPSPSPAATDTVQISNAARALQEAVETPSQTAKEASRGDRQAQRLLAKEAAASKAE